MKKILLLTNLVFIGIITFLACNRTTGTAISKDPCKVRCADYSNSKFQYLETALLKRMASDYRDSAGLNPLRVADRDATSIWFHLEDLKRFIWEIETNMCKVKCGDTRPQGYPLGIRIYYGRYPDHKTMGQFASLAGLMGNNFETRHTLFMVPTYDSIVSVKGVLVREHIDFDPHSIKSGFCPRPLAEGTPPQILAFMPTLPGNLAANYGAAAAAASSTAQNHGDLCPPLCPTDAGDAFFNQ